MREAKDTLKRSPGRKPQDTSSSDAQTRGLDMATVRYIGSKTRVVEQILDAVGEPAPRDGLFVDAFCGTGVVASEAATRGWPVRINDHLRSSTAVALARLLSTDDARFEPLGGYDAAVAALNAVEPVDGFFHREYSPASAVGRMYFTEENARRIDGIRAQIGIWEAQTLVTRDERDLLLADLISAAGKIANIAGTYGCYLTHWTAGSQRPLAMMARLLRDQSVPHESSSVDVVAVPMETNDVAYFDPPYTKRQYAAYYHINETLAHGDEPAIIGKTGLRPWKELASDYCYKSRALRALTALIADASARRVFLSYSSEGHVALEDLVAELEPYGSVELHALRTVGRYRPNVSAGAMASDVTEYLVEFVKTASRGALSAA